MVLLKAELAHCDALCIVLFRLEGPLFAGIHVGCCFFEFVAVDWHLAPFLLVAVGHMIGIRILVCYLMPLVHLDFTPQAIAIIDLDCKLLVCQLLLIHSVTYHVHQLKVIGVIEFLAIDGPNFLASLINNPRIHDNFALVFPEQN